MAYIKLRDGEIYDITHIEAENIGRNRKIKKRNDMFRLTKYNKDIEYGSVKEISYSDKKTNHSLMNERAKTKKDWENEWRQAVKFSPRAKYERDLPRLRVIFQKAYKINHTANSERYKAFYGLALQWFSDNPKRTRLGKEVFSIFDEKVRNRDIFAYFTDTIEKMDKEMSKKI